MLRSMKILSVIFVLLLMPSFHTIHTALAQNPGSTLNPIPKGGLVAEWKFNHNVKDTSGNNNNGATSGGVSFVHGKVGQAISFDRTGIDRVPNSATLNFGVGSFSISTWVKTTQTNYWIVEHRPNNDGIYAGYSIEGIGVTGDVAGRIRERSGHEILVTTNFINDNKIHHMAIVVYRSL